MPPTTTTEPVDDATPTRATDVDSAPGRLTDSGAHGAAYGTTARSGGSKLRGRPVQATWDADLTEAMLTLGRKIEEEQVLPVLLTDLAQAD